VIFFEKIARAVERAADDIIALVIHKIMKMPTPTGAWLILFRLLIVAGYLQGLALVAAGFYELYQSGWLGQALHFLRLHHPVVICIPLALLFFLLAAWLAQFKLAHKQGYGFCEFLSGFASTAGLLMIAIHFPDQLSNTEWLVGTAGLFTSPQRG
jgi:hypothetical protein